jgi:predicted CoA-binding protein
VDQTGKDVVAVNLEPNMRDINTELDIVSVFIRDADKYGLVPEVVLFALKYMKQHPESNIEDAMSYGFDEWVK